MVESFTQEERGISLMAEQRELLRRYGLLKAIDASENDWNTVSRLRDRRFAIPVAWNDVQTILACHPVLRPYLYLSTGFDGLVLLDVETGKTMSAQPLMLDLLSGNDADQPALTGMVESRVGEWASDTSTVELVRQGETEQAEDRITTSTAMAPTALKELVYMLAPWDELDDPQFQRETALEVRKAEEYPTESFDRHLVGLLARTVPNTGSDEPMERVFDSPVTVFRGELEGSVHLGLSWTTDREVAGRFAKRFGLDGVVYRAVLEPGEVLAAYADDGESEVLASVGESRVEVVG